MVLALFAIPLIVAVVSDAALSWDGAHYLFRTLDSGVPFIAHDRLIDAPIHWPVLWVNAFTDSLPILRATFGAVHKVMRIVTFGGSVGNTSFHRPVFRRMPDVDPSPGRWYPGALLSAGEPRTY